MAKPGQLAPNIGTVPERQHLMEPHVAEAAGTGLDGIENRVGRPVGHADDDIAAVDDVVKDGLGRTKPAGQCGLGVRGAFHAGIVGHGRQFETVLSMR